MNLQKNMIKSKLMNGQPVLGIWSIINSPILAEIIGIGGFDFQILDMEHGVFDAFSLDNSIRASENSGCSPIVRVPGLFPTSIQTALDLGAHGIIVPQIKDYEAAVAAVRATKFAPKGVRGFNPFTRAGGYLGSNIESTKLCNDFGLTSIIIENTKSLEDLDKILEIADLDLIYLGAYDMSVALGCMGQMNHPLILDFLKTSIKRIRAAGKAVGVMVKNENEMRHYLDLGANCLVFGVDTQLIGTTMANTSKMFNALINVKK